MMRDVPGGSAVKNLPANVRAAGDEDAIPGLGRSSGGGRGNPFQCSCLQNPMDRGAWRATVHVVTKSQTRLKQLSTHGCTMMRFLKTQGKCDHTMEGSGS